MKPPRPPCRARDYFIIDRTGDSRRVVVICGHCRRKIDQVAKLEGCTSIPCAWPLIDDIVEEFIVQQVMVS